MPENKTCPECKGDGEINDESSSSLITMLTMDIYVPLIPVMKTCPTCKGKKYIDDTSK